MDSEGRKRTTSAAANIEDGSMKRLKQGSRPGYKSNLGDAFDCVADKKERVEESEALLMPRRVNLHKAGLRRSEHIRQKNVSQAEGGRTRHLRHTHQESNWTVHNSLYHE